METLKLYGPPGAGKTFSALHWLEYQVGKGTELTETAFVSFTNAACNEARGRLCNRYGLYDYELPYCATLHALSKRSLRVEGNDWNADTQLREFAEGYGYDLGTGRKKETEDLESAANFGFDVPLLELLQWGRNRMIEEPARIFAACAARDPYDVAQIDYPRFLAFCQDYSDWKAGRFLRDFTDLLEEVVREGRRLPVSLVVLDEAQDQTPLLWAAFDTLFSDTPIQCYAGDDDQAIFSFQGCDPALFNRRETAQTFLLEQSYRLPARLVDAAAVLIGRCRNRVEKQLRPVTEAILREQGREPTPAALEGQVVRAKSVGSLPLTGGPAGGSWFLLVRNWAFVGGLAEQLEDLGIPYRIGGGGNRYSPWDEKGPLRAARAVGRLGEGEQVGVAELAALVEKTGSETKTATGTWVHGAKAKIGRWAGENPEGRVGLLDLPHLGLSQWGFDRLALGDLSLLTRITERDFHAYRRARAAGHWNTPAWVTLSTGHGAKGQERDHVAILESATRAPIRNLDDPLRCEEEYRLQYVRATRAKESLWLLPHPGGYGAPYEFPIRAEGGPR